MSRERPPLGRLDVLAADRSAAAWTRNSLVHAVRLLDVQVRRAQAQAARAQTEGIAEGCRVLARTYDDARRVLQLELDLLDDAIAARRATGRRTSAPSG